jgi:hypothetical protein
MVSESQMGLVHLGFQIQILCNLKGMLNLRVLLLMLIFREAYLGIIHRAVKGNREDFKEQDFQGYLL